jgi:hypothetical protein
MKSYFFQILTILLLISIGMVSCRSNDELNKNKILKPMQQKDYVLTIADSAFTYGVPLVLLDITQSQLLRGTSTDTAVSFNKFIHVREFLNSSDTTVVRPNADTYYSIAWLDLTGGPVLMHLPRTDSTYYMMPMLDGFTNVFKSPGTRNNDTMGGDYLITGLTKTISPGKLNDANKATPIQSNTNMVWILGRFQVNNSRDSTTVVQLQDSMKLTPLGKKEAYDNSVYLYDSGEPNTIVKEMAIDTFFTRMNALLLQNPPVKADSVIVARMKKIGVGAGLKFNSNNFTLVEKIGLNRIPKKMMKFYSSSAEKSKHITSSMWTVNLDSLLGNYGTNYLLRAVVAYAGLGANTRDDAVYYSSSSINDTTKFNSQHNYKLTFAKLPPVKAFWSLTMYDEDGYFVNNSDSIYAVGHDSNRPFYYDRDGTLSLYIQRERPKDTLYKHNWLPSDSFKNKDFKVMLRAYWPKCSIIDSTWIPPNIVRYNDSIQRKTVLK